MFLSLGSLRSELINGFSLMILSWTIALSALMTIFLSKDRFSQLSISVCFISSSSFVGIEGSRAICGVPYSTDAAAQDASSRLNADLSGLDSTSRRKFCLKIGIPVSLLGVAFSGPLTLSSSRQTPGSVPCLNICLFLLRLSFERVRGKVIFSTWRGLP